MPRKRLARCHVTARQWGNGCEFRAFTSPSRRPYGYCLPIIWPVTTGERANSQNGIMPRSSAEDDLLPLLTDADIEARVTRLIGRANTRQLWLLFLDEAGIQLPLLIPVGGLPSRPQNDRTADVLANVAELMAGIGATQIILVWERYGPASLTLQDADWALSLSVACRSARVPLRAMLLSHRAGVRWIAPDDYC